MSNFKEVSRIDYVTEN